MSVLGVVVRVSPVHRETVLQRLARTPGVDLGPDPQDGRLIAVIESTADDPAAATMAAIAGWPEVHNLSLVYEHSDAEPGDAPAEAEFDFRAWRQSVGDFARGQTSRDARPSDLPASTSAARVKPSPPQRQIQTQRLVNAGVEPMVRIERLRLRVLGIDDQCVRRHRLARLQAAADGQTQQGAAQALAPPIRRHRQPPHAKTRHRVTRQAIRILRREPTHVQFRRAQGVVAQHILRCAAVHQHVHHGHALAGLLRGVAAQVFVQRRLAAAERVAPVPGGVQPVLFKHA